MLGEQTETSAENVLNICWVSENDISTLSMPLNFSTKKKVISVSIDLFLDQLNISNSFNLKTNKKTKRSDF